MTLAKRSIDYQTTLLGVINGLKMELDELFIVENSRFIKALTKALSEQYGAARIDYVELKKAIETLRSLRETTMLKMQTSVMETSSGVLVSSASAAANEIKSLGVKSKIKSITEEEAFEILKTRPYLGKTSAEWFTSMTFNDWDRIMTTIQKSATDGLDMETLVKRLSGVYGDSGSLLTTKYSAMSLGTAAVEASSNAARLDTFMKNSSIIDGVQFMATLDSRTSKICASLDGKVWTMDQMDQVRTPPLHPNCRSVLIPYIKLTDKNGNEVNGAERAAQNMDFDAMARERWEEKNPKKKWTDLAPETRDNYYYREIRDYRKQTGHDPYRQVPGDWDFERYFKDQPSSWKRDWLGPTRYEMWLNGEIKFDDLVNPDTGFVRTIKELNAIIQGRK